jgi:hypothetical protein
MLEDLDVGFTLTPGAQMHLLSRLTALTRLNVQGNDPVRPGRRLVVLSELRRLQDLDLLGLRGVTELLPRLGLLTALTALRMTVTCATAGHVAAALTNLTSLQRLTLTTDLSTEPRGLGNKAVIELSQLPALCDLTVTLSGLDMSGATALASNTRLTRLCLHRCVLGNCRLVVQRGSKKLEEVRVLKRAPHLHLHISN